MTDIKQLIERLRGEQEQQQREYGRGLHVIDEAADALERLTQPVGVEPVAEVMQHDINQIFWLALSLEVGRGSKLYSAETVAHLQAELAEANKAAQFNFEQYQDACRLLAEECEKTERLTAERDDWKQKAIHWDGMYKYQRDCYDTLSSEKEKLQAERDGLVKTLKLVRKFTKEYRPRDYVVITIDAALAKIEGEKNG